MKILPIEAFVSDIRGNRAGDRSELIQVSATYECAGIASSITFYASISDANKYYIGQKLIISIEAKHD